MINVSKLISAWFIAYNYSLLIVYFLCYSRTAVNVWSAQAVSCLVFLTPSLEHSLLAIVSSVSILIIDLQMYFHLKKILVDFIWVCIYFENMFQILQGVLVKGNDAGGYLHCWLLNYEKKKKMKKISIFKCYFDCSIVINFINLY